MTTIVIKSPPVIRVVKVTAPPLPKIISKCQQGPAGPNQVFVQDSKPTFENVGLWIQTGLGSTGQDFSIWFEDGQ